MALRQKLTFVDTAEKPDIDLASPQRRENLEHFLPLKWFYFRVHVHLEPPLLDQEVRRLVANLSEVVDPERSLGILLIDDKSVNLLGDDFRFRHHVRRRRPALPGIGRRRRWSHGQLRLEQLWFCVQFLDFTANFISVKKNTSARKQNPRLFTFQFSKKSAVDPWR